MCRQDVEGWSRNEHHDTMKKSEQRKQNLRHKIMSQVKAFGIEVTGDFWFSLIFRTEAEMKQIAQKLGCQ
jgi:hypothetical protein